MHIHPKQVALYLSLLTTILLAPRNVQAQATSASIHGTVTDSTGAVITGAKATALDTSTGISTITKTDNKGFYTFPQLHISGPYTITIDKSGFRTFVSTGLMLNLSSERAVNATLQIGGSSQIVRVKAASAQVETSDTQLKTVIGGKEIVDVPLLGRDAVQLQKTAPGVVESSDRMGTFSTNGSQTQENSYLLDGTDINDIVLNQPGITPNPDALAEVNVISSTLNPEFSRNSGAIVDEALKSGTNQFHGDGFEFYRDTFLNNGNYFSATRPVFHQNLFGGTLGGPIFRNHAFFFLAYQGIRNRTAQTQLTPVFSQAQRNGDFSADNSVISNGPVINGGLSSNPIPFPGGLQGSNGHCPAGTPWNRCFPNAQVPISNFDSIAGNLLKQYVPLPNYNSGGINYYNFNAPNTSGDDQGIVRVDDELTQKDALWASTIFDSNPTTNTLPAPASQSTGTGATLPGFLAVNAAHIKVFNASWTHTINASTLNELRAGYFRFNYAALEPATSTLAAPSSFGFNITPQDGAVGTLPYIGVNGYFALGFSTNGPQPRIDENYDFFDNFSKVAGNHYLKVGANIQRFVFDDHFYFENSGAFNFGNASGTYTSGDPAIDFLLGVPSTFGQQSGELINVRAWEYYAYAQDNWKISDSLTVNYGSGYDTETPLENLQYSGVGVTCWTPGNVQSKVFPGAPPGLLYPGDRGCNKNGGPTTHWDHLAPRAGFAWSPSRGPGLMTGESGEHLLVLRGGFGLYWNRGQAEGTQENSSDPPFSLTSQGAAALGGSPSFANPYHDIANTPGASYATNPFPYAVPHPGQNVNFSSLFLLDMDNTSATFDVPYTYNYNLNVQRTLPSNMVMTIGYVGSLGRKLMRAFEGDQITPAGHAACLSGTGTGAPITLGGNTFSCVQLAGSQSLYFPGNKLQPGVVPGSQIPGVFQNGLPYYLSIGNMHTDGSSSYNSLQVFLEKQTTHGLYFTLAYTYSHGLDNASSLEGSAANGLGTNWVPGFQYLSYGDSDYDARHRLVGLYNYEIPLLHGMNQNKIVRYAFGSWHITGISAIQTGFPVTIYDAGVYNSLYCDQFSFISCPDVPNTSTFHIRSKNPRRAGHYWFNPAHFSQETIGTFGNVKRNFFHGPGFNYSNFEIYKNLPMGGPDSRRYFEVRLETYNAFNHANFAGPNGNFGAGSPVFGSINSVVQPVNPSGDPQPGRAVQLGGKFYF